MAPSTQKDLQAATAQSTTSLSDTERNDSYASQDVEKKGSIATLDNDSIVEVTTPDPNVVDFEGPEDPRHPHNWSVSKKWLMVAVLSAMTMLSPLASSMFAPGVSEVLEEFHSHSSVLSSFVVSIYVLGYAIGPLVVAPLSELYGRNVVYHATNFFFVVFTIVCAVSKSMGMLIAFRFLGGIAGSAVLTLGGGTIADMFVQQERGRAMAIWSSGSLIGPVIGPICGGFLAQAAGWRWVFWCLAIAAGVTALAMLLVMDETYPPIILERKVRILQKETGNAKLRSALHTGLTSGQAFARAIVRPGKMIFQPIVFMLSMFIVMTYGYTYLLFTTINEVFIGYYHFTIGTVGLTYLGIGIGMFVALFIFGYVSDKLLTQKAVAGKMRPEDRLLPMPPACITIPIGLFIYGWTAEYRVFWFVPILGTGIFGFGILIAYMSVATYLVDAFPLHASSALAANVVLRSLSGAFLPMAGPPMDQALGVGWASSVLAFIALAFLPVPFLFYKYGERIRKSPRFQTVM